MPARIVTLCEAVKDFLNGESYSQAFVATRANVPVRALEETNDLVVEVFPGEYTSDEATRADWQHEYSVNIAISQVITDADRAAQEDALLLLAEEIEDSLKDQAMGQYRMYRTGMMGGGRSHFNTDRLLAAGQFVTVLEVVYLG